MWPVEDPTAASIPVNYRGSTTLAHTALNHSSSPQYPPSAPEQLAESVPDDSDEIRLHFPYVTPARASRSTPGPSSVEVDRSTAHYPPTTPDPDPETSYSASTGSSTSPPTVKFEDSQAIGAAPSAPIAPEHNPASRAEKGSIWSEDDFIAAYQAFFLPRPIKDSSSPALALRPIHHDLDGTRAQQMNSRPVLEDRATKPARTDATTATVSYVSQTWLENGDLVDWTLRLMPVAPVDPQQSEALKIAATAGYEHTLRLQRSLISSGVPEEVYAAMHPSPPKIPSSYSEFAHTPGRQRCVLSSPSQTWHKPQPRPLCAPRLRHGTGTQHRPAAHDHFNMA